MREDVFAILPYLALRRFPARRFLAERDVAANVPAAANARQTECSPTDGQLVLPGIMSDTKSSSSQNMPPHMSPADISPPQLSTAVMPPAKQAM